MKEYAEHFQVLVDNKTMFAGYDREEAVQVYQETVSRLRFPEWESVELVQNGVVIAKTSSRD